MCFQGDHIRLRANASCFSCPAPSSLEGQGTWKIRRDSERNDRPASQSRKVFDATFYKKLRFAPLSKSGSSRLEKSQSKKM
jgi:hypothetical protein